jgi:site-specific recombinase XerD
MPRHDLAAEVFHLEEAQKAPFTLDQAEVRRLVLIAAKPRDRMLRSLRYRTGMRASEVLSLRVKHMSGTAGPCLHCHVPIQSEMQ